MPETELDFGLDGIGHQLSDRLLAVPIYQRSYAWGERQVEEFCSDLKNAFNADPSEYFLGTIVLSKAGTEGRDTIIDGQQRLATASLLLAAIRDYFLINDDESRSRGIQAKYIGSYDDVADEDIPRLCLNSDDDSFYRRWVVENDEAAQPTRESHVLIKAAYEQLYWFVDAIAEAAGIGWPSKLVEWRQFLHSRVRVIYVAVPTESDAFLIFETLNARGAELTLADLLKNYLFSKAESNLEAVRDNWLLALGAFDLDVELFMMFIRHYWSSRQGPVRERELYKSIKDDVKSRSQAVKLASELEANSKLYAALIDPDDEYWSSWGSTTKKNIETLGRLALEQNRPMLLAAMQHFTRAEMKKVLRASVSWSVRGLVVGGIGGGTTEKAYCAAALKIRAGEVKTAAELAAELASIVPSDTEFEAAFATMRVTKASLARYYLIALERQQSGEAEPELVPNANEEEVNLEHVLPKRADPAVWSGFTDDQRKDFVDRLGNHVLMSKTPNDRLGNKDFQAKKRVMAKAKLRLTKDVASKAAWGPKQIDDRQKRLAAMAVNVWQRSP
jgi:hypothetical protein